MTPESLRPRATRFRFKAAHRTSKSHTPKGHARSSKPLENAFISDDSDEIISASLHSRESRPSTSTATPSAASSPPSHTQPTEENAPPDPNPLQPGSVDTTPEGKAVSFQDSLLEALSSASSAEHWSSIYGSPIHIYARPTGDDGRPVGDAEYARYVQYQLWMLTGEGAAETQARRKAQERRRLESEFAEAQRERERVAAEKIAVEQRRAQRLRREEDIAVMAYIAAWDPKTGSAAAAAAASRGKKKAIPFPSERARQDLLAFFTLVARRVGQSVEAVVRSERVRWHPDKIIQRFGGTSDASDAVDSEAMEKVNELWREIDGLWRQLGDGV